MGSNPPFTIYPNMIKGKGIYIFCAVLLIYIVIFTGIAIWRYEHFLFNESGDLLLFEQVIYNTVHGRPFYNNFSKQNHFGDHNSPILAILVPFASIFPVPYVLYAFTGLSIAISAIPIYLIAKESLKNEVNALILSTSYLILPAFIGRAFLSFHEINLVLPFISFAFYYFVKEKIYLFITMFIMGLMVKEDVSLTFFMFAVYAFIKKREMKWYVIPAALSISWLLLSIEVIIPLFNKIQRYEMLSYFKNIGASSAYELVASIFMNPLKIIEEISQPEKLSYLLILLSPFGMILPFFSSEIIFAIPSILLNMLGGSQRLRHVTLFDIFPIPTHMSLMPSVFLFIAITYSIKRIGAFYPKQSTLIATLLSLIVISTTIYSSRYLFFSDFYRRYPTWRGTEYVPRDSIKRVLSAIPLDATVMADINIANHLYDRKEAFNIGIGEADYIVVEMAKVRTEIIEKYDLVVVEKNILLFKKRIYSAIIK